MNVVNPMKCNPASTQSYTFQFSYITHKIGFHSLPLCTSTVFFRLENHWVDLLTTYDLNELVYRFSSWRSLHTLLPDSRVTLSVVRLLTTREMPTGSGVSSLNRLQSAYLGLQVTSHPANLWAAVWTPSFFESEPIRY